MDDVCDSVGESGARELEPAPETDEIVVSQTTTQPTSDAVSEPDEPDDDDYDDDDE